MKSANCNLHFKCEVTKLGTAATGNFLLGKREQSCHNKQDFRVAKKAETPSLLNLKKCGGQWGADTCKACVAQLVL